jgi:hypothetical protein
VDATHFDTLTRMFFGPETRRRLLGTLVGAPVLGGLLAVLDPEDAEGKKRRSRRKDRHRRRKEKADSKRRKRRCKPKRKAKVCAGKCGTVKNRKTCGKRIDCGPCDCDPPCGAGTICCGGACQQCCDNSQCTDAAQPYCADGVCSSTCTAHAQCGANTLCVDGVCHACDVTCSGSAQTCGDDLQAALDGAKDTLYVCPGTYQGGFVLGRAATIIGAGVGQTVLDGNEALQVLHIAADVPVTLEALTIANGASATGGGAIRNEGDLTLVDAELTANTSTYAGSDNGGGAISNTRHLTLRNTIVHDNASAQNGGGIFVQAGSVTLDDGSSIEMNTAQQGSGIYATTNSVVTLKPGSQVFQNHASVQGGGILTRNSTLTLEGGSSVEENTTDDLGFGGGLWVQDSTVTLEPGSRVNRNHAGNLGGGLYVSLNCEVTVESGSQVMGNTAQTGGAIYNALDLLDGEIVLENGVLICGNSSPACEANHPWPVAGICPTPVDQCP